MNLFQKIRERLQARRRKIDEEILWPSLLEKGKGVLEAKSAFYVHTMRDPAWEGVPHAEIIETINRISGTEEWD